MQRGIKNKRNIKSIIYFLSQLAPNVNVKEQKCGARLKSTLFQTDVS